MTYFRCHYLSWKVNQRLYWARALKPHLCFDFPTFDIFGVGKPSEASVSFAFLSLWRHDYFMSDFERANERSDFLNYSSSREKFFQYLKNSSDELQVSASEGHPHANYIRHSPHQSQSHRVEGALRKPFRRREQSTSRPNLSRFHADH